MYGHVDVKTGTRAPGQSAAARHDHISRGGNYEADWRDEAVHLESDCMPAFASSDAACTGRRPTANGWSNGRLFDR